MKCRTILFGAITLGLVVSAGTLAQSPTPSGARAFAQWDKVQMSVEQKIGSNLAIIHGNAGVDTNHPDGSGGRVAVLYGPDGVLMVDSQNEEVHDKLLKTIRMLSSAPIKFLVNSHAHSDHSGGNAFFAKQGAVIFGQDNLRDELQPPPRPAGAPAAAPVDPAALPVVTYKYDPAARGKPAVVIHMNGETVDFIPMMPSHLGGDTIVRFEGANVIYIEDFYRNFGYPFADQGNGGSIQGMVEAVDLMMKISDDATLLIPGHGTLIHRKDLLPYRAMLVDILAKTKKMVDGGKSLEEVLAANLTAPYDANTKGDDPVSIRRYITETYYEVKGLPPIVHGRRTMPSPPSGMPLPADTAGKKP